MSKINARGRGRGEKKFFPVTSCIRTLLYFFHLLVLSVLVLVLIIAVIK